MAKRECPFCKEKVEEKATICKYCKSELPPLPPKKWYQTWKGLILVLFVLGVFVRIFEEGPPTRQSTNTSGNSKKATQQSKIKSSQMLQQQAFELVQQSKSAGLIYGIQQLDEKMMYVTVGRKFYNLTAQGKRGFGEVLSLAYPRKFINVADAYTEKIVLSVLPDGDTRIVK